MPYQTVHATGSTIYFVFLLLFLWMSRVPRTNPGAGWWALAMLFALLARLIFLFLLPQHDASLVITVYWGLNVLEKLCLVVGLVRFFGVPVRLQWACIATVAVEGWVLASWLAGVAPLVRGLGVAAFNIGMLLYVALLAYRNQHLLQTGLLRVTTLSSLVLVGHWASVYFIIDRVPAWFDYGFMLGSALVLVQYFSLLAALLLSFQQRLLAAESKALDMAFQDPLTGLNNQRYMSTLFDKVLALATRPHQLLAVFYIDLDNFKPINDSAGHKVGDEVLKTVASRLKHATRSTDICARVGGDEFVVLCTQLEQAEQAHDIAGKLLDTLTSPITVEGKAYVLGASLGVSLYPLHGTSLPQLLEYADSAMYEVKRSGKKGYRIYAAEPAAVQL